MEWICISKCYSWAKKHENGHFVVFSLDRNKEAGGNGQGKIWVKGNGVSSMKRQI